MSTSQASAQGRMQVRFIWVMEAAHLNEPKTAQVQSCLSVYGSMANPSDSLAITQCEKCYKGGQPSDARASTVAWE